MGVRHVAVQDYNRHRGIALHSKLVGRKMPVQLFSIANEFFETNVSFKGPLCVFISANGGLFGSKDFLQIKLVLIDTYEKIILGEAPPPEWYLFNIEVSNCDVRLKTCINWFCVRQ